MEEKNYDEEVVEETTTEETAPEEDVNETDEGFTDSDNESEEDIDWKARAIKAEKAIEKAKKKQKGEKTEEDSDPDRLNRLELKADGIKEKEDQDYVLKVAKAEGVDPSDIISDKEKYDFVHDRLAANKRARQSAQATPRSNNRAGVQTDEIAALARKYQKDGSLPDEPAKVAKIMDYLKTN